jgi:hypothetical protein
MVQDAFLKNGAERTDLHQGLNRVLWRVVVTLAIEGPCRAKEQFIPLRAMHVKLLEAPEAPKGSKFSAPTGRRS